AAAISGHSHSRAARGAWRARAAGRPWHHLTDLRSVARRRQHDRLQVGRDNGCCSAILWRWPIEGVALHWFAANRPDERFHLVRRQLLAVLSAGGARDALVH